MSIKCQAENESKKLHFLNVDFYDFFVEISLCKKHIVKTTVEVVFKNEDEDRSN